MAWTPPAEEEKKPTGTSWTPPENEVKKIWTPPAEDDPENPVNEKEPWRLKKLKESGVTLSEEQEKLLWKYEEDRPLLDKAGEAVRTFFPAAAKVANQLGTGSVDLIYKGVLKPIDAMSQTPEEAEKTFKEAGNAWRSFGSGAMSDMEETIDMATRFSMFGSGITDKLQGLPEEERFKRFKNREVMRQFGQAVREEMPDRAAALISENPFLKKAAGAYAKLSGGTPEEVKMAEEAFTELVKESGLTKEELDENISMLGEFMSPVALPGGNRITGAIAKPLGKVVQKTGELALRGIKPIAGAVEGAAELTLKGTELVQGGARKIGEYTTNDPDTLLRTGANTVIMPINAVAKPTSNVARVVKDVTSQVDVGGAAGRRGLFERAGRAETSSDLTRRLFGPQGKGGVARAKVADWTVRQANAIIQPGVNGAALNVLMGLPDIETAAQLGEVAGTGFGIGGFAGARVFDRAGAIIDPTTSLAEKITTVVTPDMAQRRRDEDADIKRFIATATPEMKSQMEDLSNIDKRKTAIDSKLINLRQQKERTINAADEANLQRQIDGFEKQRQALDKATPETVREAERQVQLAFMDAMDLAQATGTSAGLRGLNLTVLNADNAEGFFRNLYGGAVERAEGVVNLLTGRTDLTMQESQNLQQARELLNRFSTEVAGAKNQRGFAIGVDGTDPNADGYVAPHLRKVNQTGATAVINGDLVKHLSEQGFDVRRVINHEMQHALQQFREVKDMLSPIRGDLFDQKVVKDDGTVEVWKQGIFSDADIARYGANYAAKMSPADNGASFIAQFQDVDAFNAYIKDEILAEVASQTGDYSNGTRAALDDVGRNLVDWLEVKTKAGALRKMKEGLRNFGIVFDNYGGYSNVLGADLPPEALAMIRQYQRQLRDFDGSMQIQTTREEDAPDIPMTAILGSRALQEKYKDADFFEKEQILRSTAPDGTVTEIVMPKGAKLDPFVDIYRIQGGQLVDANGNPVQLPPEITFGSLPEGSTFQMDTRIARKPDGSPITLSAREIKSRALERTQSIRNVIDSAPDDGTPNRLIDTGNGNYRGVMSPSQLAAVLSIPNSVLAPALKRQIQFFNELMQRGDGTRAIFEYQAALLNGKYKAIAPKIRDEVPIGWQFTKDGNFALTTISVSRLYDKLQAWADQGTVTQEQTWTGELIPVKRSKNLALWNGDTNKFWNSLVQVLDNHANGREGWVGLHSDELTAKRMRNKVNDLFNVFNKETKEMNPDRSTLPRVRGRDNVDIIVRSRRVDRINSFSESPSIKVPVNYGKLLINYMPETTPLAAPQTPEQFMENINGSVSATRIRNAIATGAVDQLEAELRNSDDLLPTESLFVSQGEGGDPLIQVTSMLDPNVEGALEPEEVVVDLDARTAAELARLEAEEQAAMAAQQQAPVEPAPAPEPAPEPAPAPTTQFMPAEAPSGERGFQSKLQLEIQKKFQGATATPQQLKAVLGNPQNVKAEEVKWSGVMDEIDRLAQENNGKVPVQELLNYLRNEGQVKFEEVILGGVSKLRTQDEIDQLERQAQRTGRWDEYEQAVLEFEDQQLGSNANQTGNLTIHAKYQLPGGENYREVVMTMPSDLSRSQAKIDAINKRRKEILNISKEQDLFKRSQTDPEAKALNDSFTAEFVQLGKQADQLNADIREGKTGEQYTSSHFPDVPNYIAHMRLNERTDAEGNPGLFVEEFQSDRHQQGREKGYVGEQEIPEGYKLIDENQSAREAGYEVPSDAPPRWRYEGPGIFSRIYDSKDEAIEAAWKDVSYAGKTRVPDAPFRKDWGVQLFKRALRDAVESGKKWIGWTTGIEQVKRYENAIRQTVDRINWNTPVGSPKTFSATKNNNIVIVGQINNDGLVYDSDVEDFNGMQLSEVFGKEIAAKILAEDSGTAAGDDLTIGGEGMKGFYDQILPKEIGKYVAKMGGKVEKSKLSQSETFDEYLERVDPPRSSQYELDKAEEEYNKGNAPIWRVNITPEMENVVRAGQIQFMPAVQAVPERFTGTGEKGEDRRGRYVAPPEFWTRFDIGEFERGGKFFDMETGEDITDKNYATGTIDVTGKRPSLISDTIIDEMPEEKGRTWKTNLFRKSAVWEWISENPPKVAAIGSKEKPDPVLISVEGGKDHFYTLKAEFPNGVQLARYPDEGSEPRLRPTKKGQIQLGNVIGRIKTKSKEHPVYDTITIGQQFMPAESDAEYLRLAQDPEANQEKLQRMVDEAAKRAGLKEAFHGTSSEAFSVFKTPAWFTSRDSDHREDYADFGREMRVYLDIRNPKIDETGIGTGDAGIYYASEREVSGLIELGFDGKYSDRQGIFVAFNPEQIKSADPVTYDDAGNVIPLSQRFNPESESILFAKPRQTKMDRDYLAAVERGDMETAQRMVDSQQRVVQKEPLLPAIRMRDGAIIDVGDPKSVHLDVATEAYSRGYTDGNEESAGFVTQKSRQYLKGLEITRYLGLNNEPGWSRDWPSSENFDDEGYMQREPVLRDQTGSIIPLSQRFQTTTSDIRFMPAESDVTMPVAKVLDVYEREKDPNLVRLGMDIDLFPGKREARVQVEFNNLEDVDRALSLSDNEDAISLPEWISATIESKIPGFKSSGWGYLSPEDIIDNKAMISVGEDVPAPENIIPFSPDIRFMPEEQGPLADIQAPEQRGEKAALEDIQIPLEIEKPIGKNDPLPTFKSTIVDGTTPLDKFDWSYPTNVQYKSKNGETFTFSYDPKLLVEPPIKDLVDELKGQPVIMLEADRQRATGGDMGGPLHPFLKSNQVSVMGSDGIEYKPVWANMTSTFISGTKGRLASHGAKHAVVHLMDNIAHKSNKRTVRTLDKMMREANLKKFDKEIVALAMQAGIIEGKKSKINAGITALKRKLSGANAKKTALIKKQIDILLEKRNAITPQGATGEIFKAVSKIKTAQSNVKTGRWKQSTVENAINNLKSMSDRKEYKQILRKLKSLFISDNIGKTFNDRGSAVSAILSFKFGSFEPMVVLRDSSDFKDNENLDIVTVVELSQNPEFFALYFGNDPKQEAAMSPAEKQARDQMRDNPNFVEHEAYDWVMLGPKDGNNFLVRNPMKPEEVFKEYRLAHPKQTVKKGSDETVAGAMRKFAGVKLIVDEMAEPVVANKKSKK